MYLIRMKKSNLFIFLSIVLFALTASFFNGCNIDSLQGSSKTFKDDGLPQIKGKVIIKNSSLALCYSSNTPCVYLLPSSISYKNLLLFKKYLIEKSSIDKNGNFKFPALSAHQLYNVIIDINDDGHPEDLKVLLAPHVYSKDVISYIRETALYSDVVANVKVSKKKYPPGGKMNITVNGYTQDIAKLNIEIYNEDTGEKLFTSTYVDVVGEFRETFYMFIPTTWNTSNTCSYVVYAQINDNKIASDNFKIYSIANN